jgi:phage shock protein A
MIDQQKTMIDSLNSTNQQLQSAANQPVLAPVTATTTVEDVITQTNSMMDQKDQQIAAMNSTIEQLNGQISSLTATMNATLQALSQINGLQNVANDVTPTPTATESNTSIANKLINRSLANIRTNQASSQKPNEKK